jgi:outer membrane protein insertion porin family
VLESKQAGLLRQLIRRDTFVEDRLQFDGFFWSGGFSRRAGAPRAPAGATPRPPSRPTVPHGLAKPLKTSF